MIRSELEIVESIIAPYRQIEELQAQVERLTAKSEDLEKCCDEQAARIEALQEALSKTCNIIEEQWEIGERTIFRQALSITPNQALEQFATKVRAQALEDAAVNVEGLEGEFFNGDEFVATNKYDCAAAIREMKKEMK